MRLETLTNIEVYGPTPSVPGKPALFTRTRRAREHRRDTKATAETRVFSSTDQPAGRSGEFPRRVRSRGRAIVLPVYKSTGERRDELTSDFPTTSAMFRDHVVMWSKDVQGRGCDTHGR